MPFKGRTPNKWNQIQSRQQNLNIFLLLWLLFRAFTRHLFLHQVSMYRLQWRQTSSHFLQIVPLLLGKLILPTLKLQTVAVEKMSLCQHYEDSKKAFCNFLPQPEVVKEDTWKMPFPFLLMVTPWRPSMANQALGIVTPSSIYRMVPRNTLDSVSLTPCLCSISGFFKKLFSFLLIYFWFCKEVTYAPAAYKAPSSCGLLLECSLWLSWMGAFSENHC